jgi:tripartite-type tricarboxylate transporter receptor subunit TctC
MQKHMPGQPVFVTQNVPGAGSLLLANQLYNTQPKDGTVFGLINRGVPFEPLLGGQGDRFDPLKFNYIGSPDRDVTVCAVRNDAPVKKLEDLLTTQLIVGGTGPGADSQTYPEVLSKLLGLKIKIVSGYPGSRDILLATERNEVQGGCLSYDTIARDAFFRDKKSHILFQAALKSDPRIPDVPLATSLAKNDNEKKALELFFDRSLMGRPFVAPPNVPADRVKALQTAFAEAVKDPEFAEDAKKSNVNINYVPPEELLEVVKNAAAAPKETVALTKQAFGRK